MYWLFCLSVCILSSSPISFQSNTLKCNGSISIIHKEHELCIVMLIALAAFEAIFVLLLKKSCGKLLLLRRTWQCPSHPHLSTIHPPLLFQPFPRQLMLSLKKYKACESLNPNQSSLFIPVLIPVMFQWRASHWALCCFKTLQWNRPLHPCTSAGTAQVQVQEPQLLLCHSSALSSSGCKLLEIVKLCRSWREGKTCRVLGLIPVALRIW